MYKFILASYTFKQVFIATVVIAALILMSSRIFDHFWGSSSTFALTDLNDVYVPPVEYDNIKKINMSYIPPDFLCIEGNKKLKIEGKQKDFSFFDTVKIIFPSETNEYTNKIYFRFEDEKNLDSVFLVTAKSDKPNIFWKQIFLSSVIVKKLNNTGQGTANFRIDKNKLVSNSLLENNDSLINVVLQYFNTNKDTLKLAECGRNSYVFKIICDMFSLPCRMIMLQGGDADISGYDNEIGYPTHVVCEIYSSRFQKWYVIDPTYGFRFKEKGTEDFINAIEINNRFFFQREKDIVQDSILFTKRTLLERDYFKYYENIYFNTDYYINYFRLKFYRLFFNKFNYNSYLYSNLTPFVKNGKNYIIFKSIMYLILLLIHANYVMYQLSKRLMQAKKTRKK